ncbi:TPM domain-containing protein [Parasporobacterium paucivorans]|uniref:TPM domain-containing protein n=1 Tax=Parasporobacterium paucivorans DSM 15970 TaxID=1122934 RepID=A0A1M6D8H2_9FIRM|nr:TPM domain-containing protein [Parasporobacterium paucivorans]SHI69298.1 uncharacterized protein SAMN02745691_00691 [Parasporobacterium paucivorans DSM 15970]
MIKKFRKLSYIIIPLLCIIFISGFDSSEDKVYDNAGLFTQEQILNLNRTIRDYDAKTELDLVIVTVDQNNKSTQQYAEDFYTEHAFGYEHDYGSGVILVIDMDNREAYVSTQGIAIQYLDDAAIQNILDEIFVYLPNGDYYNSARVFLEKTRDYALEYINNPDNSQKIEAWKTEGYTDYAEYYHDFYEEGGKYYVKSNMFTYLKNPFISIGIGAVIALITVLIMMHRSKTRVTVNAYTYMDEGKLSVNRKEDMFIGTTTVTRVIKRSGGGGSGGRGGSFHTGSGGRSFGGGGRGF